MTEKTGLVGLAPRRKKAGLTQEAFAARLEVSRSLIAMWETGASWPSSELLPEMAKVLNCTIEDLYTVPADESIVNPKEEEMPCRTIAEIST